MEALREPGQQSNPVQAVRKKHGRWRAGGWIPHPHGKPLRSDPLPRRSIQLLPRPHQERRSERPGRAVHRRDMFHRTASAAGQSGGQHPQSGVLSKPKGEHGNHEEAESHRGGLQGARAPPPASGPGPAGGVRNAATLTAPGRPVPGPQPQKKGGKKKNP